tara:strand:- start:8 stop:391 length:384 start_codon:yes stop_codon:yes gene_type:complete
MELPNIREITQLKYWHFNPSKNYDFYLGKKIYICTKWDDPNKINIKNYGKLVDINESFVCINTGYHTGYIELPRLLYYTNDEIKFIFLKIYDNVSIKSSYRNINKIQLKDDYNECHQRLIKNNFRTI